MRKFLLLLSVIALCAVMGCNSKNGTGNEAQQQVESEKFESINDSLRAVLEDVLEEMGIKGVDVDVDVDKDFISFFTTVFNERLYEDDGFIIKYCSDKLKKKLEEAYEYEGGGYATWLFRSDAQDGPDEHKITKMVPEGDGWYKYDFIDMGITGSHRIKVIPYVHARGVIEYCIDDLE